MSALNCTERTHAIGAVAGLSGAGQARIDGSQITVAPGGELFGSEVAVETHAPSFSAQRGHLQRTDVTKLCPPPWDLMQQCL